MEKQLRHFRFSMLTAKQINPVDLHEVGGLPLSQRTPKQVQFGEGEIQGWP